MKSLVNRLVTNHAATFLLNLKLNSIKFLKSRNVLNEAYPGHKKECKRLRNKRCRNKNRMIVVIVDRKRSTKNVVDLRVKKDKDKRLYFEWNHLETSGTM